MKLFLFFSLFKQMWFSYYLMNLLQLEMKAQVL